MWCLSGPNLESEVVAAHRIVIADHSVFLDAQNVSYIVDKRHEGRQVALWRFDKPCIVFGCARLTGIGAEGENPSGRKG